MLRRTRLAPALALLILLIPAAAAQAWNFLGHRAIVTIAFRQLDPGTRDRVAAALRTHPAAGDLWAHRRFHASDPALDLFWNASTFPDEARQAPYTRYGRSRAHFVNYRVMADQGNRVDPPVAGENIINSYVAHLRKLQDPKATADDQAVSLSWVLHQAGDVHQPMHAVARFTAALPEGDRGGNAVTVPNPRGHASYSNNLHAYWDDLLGADDTAEAIQQTADDLMREYPREAFATELARPRIQQWAEESAQAAVSTAYRNLDPALNSFADLPVGYEADARRLARKRAALAGYRLADELKRIYGQP